MFPDPLWLLLLLLFGIGTWFLNRSTQMEQNGSESSPIPDAGPSSKSSLAAPSPGTTAATELTLEPTMTDLLSAPEPADHSDEAIATPLSPDPETAEPPPVSSVPPLSQTDGEWDAEFFKQGFAETMQRLHGKPLSAATAQDCYVVLALMMGEQLGQFTPPEQVLLDPTGTVPVLVAPEYIVGPLLESNLTYLGLLNPVFGALASLGIDLNDLFDQERPAGLGEDGLGCVLGGYLESLATAGRPAIGYGIRYVANGAGVWERIRPALSLEVGFGGLTESYTDEQGRFRVRWIPQDRVRAVPYDTVMAGYGSRTVSLLRLWAAEPDSLSQQPYGVENPAPHEEQHLKQQYFLVSCAVQDALRLHLTGGASIAALPQRLTLHLYDTPTVLTILELMHQLMDRHGLDWEMAWNITQNATTCTLPSLMPDAPGDRWSWRILRYVLPRHSQILQELDRRFLEQVHARYPEDGDRWGRLAIVDWAGDRVWSTHLACVSSGQVRGWSPRHTQILQTTLLSDLAEVYPAKFVPSHYGISARRFLLLSNPRLADLFTRWLGNGWMKTPDALLALRDLVNNAEFCGAWWQIKRENKEDLVAFAQQYTGTTLNINSMFDVQAMPIQTSHRQMLNVLHILTLYLRLKGNSSTDTIQRFSHRSIPRTCLFVGRPAPQDGIAQDMTHLIEAIATVINSDTDVQGRLQVALLKTNNFQALRYVYPAADLLEHLALPGQLAPGIPSLKLALNGAITLSTNDLLGQELQQAIGGENGFWFGPTEEEVKTIQTKGYDPLRYYTNDPELQQAIHLIASGFFSGGDTTRFKALGNWLFTVDPTLVLADYQAYLTCQEQVSQACQDQKGWTWMAIRTVAAMNQFLSDRAIGSPE